MNFPRTTILGGLLFLLPLVVAVAVIGKGKTGSALKRLGKGAAKLTNASA